MMHLTVVGLLLWLSRFLVEIARRLEHAAFGRDHRAAHASMAGA